MKKRTPIKLSDTFTLERMIRFTLPSIVMMVFSSLYSMVDGFFISNFVGAVPFASLNLVLPFIMILAAVGFMFGSGGTALVSMLLGMGEKKKANDTFSLLVCTLALCGVVVGALGFWVAPWISHALGATEEMLPYAVLYIRINMLGIPFYMLQNLFQSFLVTAQKPKLGLAVTVIAGCTNMVLDALFVGVFRWGLGAAAFATIISEMVGGLIPALYFLFPNSSLLHLRFPRWNTRAIIKTCTNGSSEFLSNCASSIVGMLYNMQLLKYDGANGVAAYGVIMYVNYLFVGIYFGYTMGISPVIGYQWGAARTDDLKGTYRKSMRLIMLASAFLTMLSEVTARPLVRFFVGYDAELMALTLRGFRIYAIAFLFMGFNIFCSGFFTALNNGGVSAFLSVSRSLVLELVFVYVLPILFGADGIWLAVVASDWVCLFLTCWMLEKYRNVYGY